MTKIILLSKLLGDYNLSAIEVQERKIILLSKLLGDYNYEHNALILT